MSTASPPLQASSTRWPPTMSDLRNVLRNVGSSSTTNMFQTGKDIFQYSFAEIGMVIQKIDPSSVEPSSASVREGNSACDIQAESCSRCGVAQLLSPIEAVEYFRLLFCRNMTWVPDT